MHKGYSRSIEDSLLSGIRTDISDKLIDEHQQPLEFIAIVGLS